VTGASLLAAGDGVALAGATRRARTPATGRRQSAFGAARRRRSAPNARRRRPPRPSPPHHTPAAPREKRRGGRVGAGGWQHRRTGERHVARTHTGCGAPPVVFWGSAPPLQSQCAPCTASPATAPLTAAPHPHSPSQEEAWPARRFWRLASAALAGVTRRARIPAAGRRQSAFEAAPRRLSAPHARRRRPPRPSPPHHTPTAPREKMRGGRVGAGGWQQRRTGRRHAARTYTGCGAPPVGLWGGAPPPQSAPRTAAPATHGAISQITRSGVGRCHTACVQKASGGAARRRFRRFRAASVRPQPQCATSEAAPAGETLPATPQPVWPHCE